MLLSLLPQEVVLLWLPCVYGRFGLLKLHNIEYSILHRTQAVARTRQNGPIIRLGMNVDDIVMQRLQRNSQELEGMSILLSPCVP